MRPAPLWCKTSGKSITLKEIWWVGHIKHTTKQIPASQRESVVCCILRMRVWPSWRVFPWNWAPRMAGEDWKLVADFALTPTAEKGFPRPLIFSVLLSKKVKPLLKFWGHCTTFTPLLFVAGTNIYWTVAKTNFCSHRLQCWSVIPISVRYDCSTIDIRQTRILSIDTC